MLINPFDMLRAGEIVPGATPYIVVERCGDLQIGDRVILRSLDNEYLFVRTGDMTVHRIHDEGNGYVRVVPAPE